MVTLAVLAGGKSSRMGENKAWIPFLGIPLIERVVNRLHRIAAEVLIVTGNPDEIKQKNWNAINDQIPGKGPLVGLYSAILEAKYPLIALVACDMPFVNPDLFLWMLSLSLNSTYDVIVPESHNGLEPLHAVYRKSTCLPEINKSIERGDFRMISWFSNMNVRTIPPEDVARFDPNLHLFINVNTHADLDLAEKISKGMD